MQSQTQAELQSQTHAQLEMDRLEGVPRHERTLAAGLLSPLPAPPGPLLLLLPLAWLPPGIAGLVPLLAASARYCCLCVWYCSQARVARMAAGRSATGSGRGTTDQNPPAEDERWRRDHGSGGPC